MPNPNLNNQKELNKIVKTIVERYKPEKVILFGSYARGDFKGNSDIDLLVIKETNKRSVDRIGDVLDLVYQDEKNWLLGIEPIVCTPKEFQASLKGGDFFIKKIIREGKVLYE